MSGGVRSGYELNWLCLMAVLKVDFTGGKMPHGGIMPSLCEYFSFE